MGFDYSTPLFYSNRFSPVLDDSYDPYKAAYASMPTSAAANQEVKQQYVNGHFCYAYKFGISTNGLGIVRSIDFYNKDYLDSHPDIIVEKKSKSPDEDKSLADSKALIPTMKFVCPKMKWEYNREDKSKRRVCHCNNPCTTSSCGRMIYVYPEKT